jgi:ABC-type sulfate transport system permease component
MLVVLVLGTAPAHLLSKGSLPFLRLPSVFVELPIVMPPAVAVLALLAAFGRKGLLTGMSTRPVIRGYPLLHPRDAGPFGQERRLVLKSRCRYEYIS